MTAVMKEVPMAVLVRVGAGTLVERRFQPDVLEEIRIMAEAAQAALVETAVRPARAASPFARLLGRVLAVH
jgi:hypothetical protein